MTDAVSGRRVVVIGALSAIAEATCRRLAAEGAALALLARDETRLEAVAEDLRLRGAAQVIVRAEDLVRSDPEAALAACREALGGIDAILLFYGLLGDQGRAEQDLAHARQILDVNFTSAAGWMLAGAQALEARAEAGGVLLAVSSVGGDRGRRSNYVYGAAKGGLSILMQGIAHRFGAAGRHRAVVMKLGFVDTPMTAGFDKGGPLWAQPDQIAAAIRRAMDHGGPIVYAPFFWRWIMLAIRLTPQAIFNRVNL
ncbi:MAG: SDR family NAD(P)-dependent oxidoreductase [Phenylobacterium sp.]|uniref:SDR family NAD(P)-dependent oxidoreductase n=1 Tax=Phenylobacterium sp. TaxID=1871053 RepID=UPI0039196729